MTKFLVLLIGLSALVFTSPSANANMNCAKQAETYITNVEYTLPATFKGIAQPQGYLLYEVKAVTGDTLDVFDVYIEEPGCNFIAAVWQRSERAK